MCYCEICGEKADIHHIIHKHEGGYDFDLNYKQLCPLHHRGPLGPHHCSSTDIKYKLELQGKLINLLPNIYYHPKELLVILKINSSSIKRLLKGLSIHKEGYLNIDIIKSLMGGKLYNKTLFLQLETENISI